MSTKRIALAGFFALGFSGLLLAFVSLDARYDRSADLLSPREPRHRKTDLIPYEPRSDRDDPEQGVRLKKLYPSDPRSYFIAAFDAAYVCDHATSEDNIRRALAMALRHPSFKNDPDRIAYIRFMLAGTLFIRRKYSEALEQDNILIDDDPRNVMFIFRRSKNLFAMKRYGAVRANADRLIYLEPESFEGYFMRASAYYREGRYTAAIIDFAQANKNSPDSSILMMQLGMAQAADGQYAEALATYDAALEIERRKREYGDDTEIEDDILSKRAHAEAAMAAIAALGPEARTSDIERIRADLFTSDLPPDTPSNSLGCKG